MIYNTFTNEQDAINAQEVDFQMFKASRPQMPAKYWEITTKWAEVIPSLDGTFWAYDLCPDGVQTHNQIEYDPALFYLPEE
jgi:hypothetical protein